MDLQLPHIINGCSGEEAKEEGEVGVKIRDVYNMQMKPKFFYLSLFFLLLLQQP